MNREWFRDLSFANRTYLVLALGGTVVILAYALFATRTLLSGPSLTLITPRDNLTYSGALLIEGRTARVSYLSVNGSPVPLAEDGSFALERAYPPGYTVLEVRARDRFGREVVRTVPFIQTYELMYGAQKEGPAD